jgi:bacillithiol system protein YtxJ
MKWDSITSMQQVDTLLEESKQKLILFFKHSTRCSISAQALAKIERQWTEEWNKFAKLAYLDILKYREVSNYVSQKLNVEHQSPQLLVVKEGVCIFNSSHNAINLHDVSDQIKKSI